MPVAWGNRFAGSSVIARWLPPAFNNGLDPDTTEGAIDLVYALPNLRTGRVEQSNFDNYQALRMNEAPEVEVHIVQSQELPGGMGEAGTSLIVPAVTNAIFAATGKRLRNLPINTSALKQPT